METTTIEIPVEQWFNLLALYGGALSLGSLEEERRNIARSIVASYLLGTGVPLDVALEMCGVIGRKLYEHFRDHGPKLEDLLNGELQ